MTKHRCFSIALGMLTLAGALQAASVTYQYSGSTQNLMTINNGANSGTVPVGTPFSGTFTFDNAQTGTQVPYNGGTHGTYTFSNMTMTMGGSTVSFGPGVIDLFYHLTSTVSYPAGDSFYVNFNGPTFGGPDVPPGGLLAGVSFNWVQLALVDSTGTAFTSAALPTNLNFASFQERFVEFNYGTSGIPTGAGNTSMIQNLSTLVSTVAVYPTITTTSLPNATYGVPYNVPVTASAPNNDALTLTVTGLPGGLSFNGTTIVGAGGLPGTASVTITATDTVTSLATSSTLTLVTNDAPIAFAPKLASGVSSASYSSSFAPASGGTGLFTYSATGLPTGLSLTGNLVSGIPAAAGATTVYLTATDSSGSAVTVPVTLSISSSAPVPCSGTNAVESGSAAGYITVNGGGNVLNTLLITSSLSSTNVTYTGGLTSYNQNGLILSWTGTVAATGCTLTQLTVAPAVTISTTTLPNATVGLPYTAPVVVAWGIPAYSVTLTGLPAGLSYSGGSITGTPSLVGVFAVGITAVDSTGASATKTLNLTVLDQAIVFAPVLPAGTVGTAYTVILSATGFGPFVYGATGLPAGLTLTGNTISGLPSAPGTFSVTLTATDAAKTTSTAHVTLVVNAASTGPVYTIEDESQGKITAIAPDLSYLMVGAKKLIWNSSTWIQVNTNGPDLHTVTSFVKTGMLVQWKGLLDKATNTVLTSQLEIN